LSNLVNIIRFLWMCSRDRSVSLQ